MRPRTTQVDTRTTKVGQAVENDAGRGFGVVLPFVLVITMTMGAFQLIALAVVANDMLDDLGMSAAVFGALTAVNTIVGALFAQKSGRLSDRIGPKASVIWVLVLSAVGLFITAVANGAILLLVAVFISGFGQGWCNPSTNKLIAERVPAGNRGVITGVKQSGVQLGTLLAGVTLPSLALAFSWRAGMVAYGLLATAAAIATWLLLPPDTGQAPTANEAKNQAKGPLGRPILMLSLYALLMGTVVGGVGRFLPLFVEDELGLSNVLAGLVSGLLGGLAVFTRIAWARIAERHMAPSQALFINAGLTTVAMFLLVAAISFGSWLVWVMAVVGALGLNAWNAVAMLAVISGVPSQQAGRASGVVVAGFMAGLSTGGIYAGVIWDQFGSYRPVWITFAALAAAAAVVAGANGRVGEAPSGTSGSGAGA
ncbi:MAG: putative MFS family arabinose efflux permease [Acidimicrobiales bacterium]